MLKRYLYEIEENKVIVIYATRKKVADKIIEEFREKTGRDKMPFCSKKSLTIKDTANFKTLNEQQGHELSDQEIEQLQLEKASQHQLYRRY